ncbi:MAG: sulfatase-like hydrolase/transferase, partial [Planctomycetes bacterium]|nr:sulfatase-like hydrolase/transferase [Planctomycetota bacterium]
MRALPDNIVLTTLVLCCHVLAAEPSADRPPNVLLVMADDLGAKELGCYGHSRHRTPNLDRLAAGGVRFETCWATPLCSPSRVEIMTGRYGFHTGWYNFIGRVAAPTYLGAEIYTFGDLLKSRGYATGLAGKWQLNYIQQQPRMILDSGFDAYCVWAWEQLPADAKFEGTPRQRYWHPAVIQDGKHLPTTPEQYGPDVYSGWVIDFMRKNKDRPFFAYYPACLTHSPWDPTPAPEHPGQKTEGGFQANLEYLDHVMGRLIQALDDLGLRKNTIVLFTGDNGTGKSGKGTVTELGVRVPLIANCPGRVKSGVVSRELVDFSDFFPTLAEWTGATIPKDLPIDGQSFACILRGGEKPGRDWIFSYLG